MMMRIQKTKYYLMSKQVKDCFGCWIDKPEVSIVTGHKACNEKPYIIELFNPAFMTGDVKYELHDGHIRGFRPITNSIRRAIDFLDNNKFSEISIIS